MAYLTDRKYSFVSTALDTDTFAVVDFTGEEGLSRCYRFEVMLVTDNAEIDLGSVVQNQAKFTIHRDQEDDVDFHGILESFEQLQEVDTYVFYRATLVPKLWWLTLTHHNQVFLDKTVKEIVEAVLKDGGLTALDFEFRLQGQYEKQAYVCQYGETHLNFISRWLEREGIYYYFEQAESGEKIIITDTAISHTDSPHGGSLHYAPPSGLGDAHRREIIQGFVCRYNTLPRKIRLKDYNYRKPSLEMAGSAMVDEKGRGEIYYYGEHFRTPEEGNRLAGIRAQELLCKKEEFIAESTAPYIQPGYTFTLQDHYRSSFNRKYLTAEMTHEGSQTGYLVAGIIKGLSGREEKVFYQNQFRAIPGSVQFRPPGTAEKPKITGTLNAKIDAAGSGKYAELDEQGRYKVILPFDMSGRKAGKASTWLRMTQPYAGSNHGMHFPLHKDTEVLLTFIEGNPDRPIIAGAAPNPEMPSQVTSDDQTMSKITTSGGNKIHMEDQEGKQRILLHTPKAGTFVRLGSPNDPDDGLSHKQKEQVEEMIGKGAGECGLNLVSEKGIHIQAGGKNEIILGECAEIVGGGKLDVVLGTKNDVVLIDMNELVVGLKLALELAVRGTYGPTKWALRGSHERAELTHTRVVGERIDTAAQNIRAHGESIRAHGETINTHGQNIEVIGQQIQAKDQVIRTLAQEIDANANTIRAHGQTIRAHGESIDAHGQSIKTIGSAMKTVGSKMETAAQHMFQCGSKISNAGLKLEEGGVTMRSAGLIVDG